jgi:hypothetical protein
MPSMPFYYVGKGPQFRVIDTEYAGDEAAYMSAYDDALAVLEGEHAMSFAEIAQRHTDESSDPHGGLTGRDVEHFERHWLAGWWPQHPVEQLLRHGLIEAITVAKEARLPLEGLWVCAEESEADAFHVYICRGPRQVTMIVYTPPPKEWVADDDLTEPEPIWVVKVRDEYDERMPGEPQSLTRVGHQEIIKRQLWCTPA